MTPTLHFRPSTVFPILVAVALGFTTVACGPTSSKPSSLQKYSDLKKKMGPVHNVPAPVQTYLPANLYMIKRDLNTPLQFIVGQRTVVRFQTGLNLAGTRYRLVSKDLPRGAEALKDLGQGVWEVAWTPKASYIPAHEISRTGGFHLSLDIYQVTDPRSEALVKTLSTEEWFEYTVVRSGAAPEIVEITGISPYPQITRLTEGDVLKLAITVRDPSATGSQKPRLIPVVLPNRLSQEQNKVSGHAFLFLETEPVLLKEGLWQFQALFDTKNNSVPEFNIDGQTTLAPSLLVDLGFQVLSPNRTITPVKTIAFEITYRRELLKPSFRANPELQIIQQGTTWTYTFESYLPSPVGNLTLYLAEETVRLAGAPKMTCRLTNKANSQHSCQITWKIPCSIAVGDLPLRVIAAAEYQGQNTSTEFIKKLSITENAKCVPAKPKDATVGGEDKAETLKDIETKPIQLPGIEKGKDVKAPKKKFKRTAKQARSSGQMKKRQTFGGKV